MDNKEIGNRILKLRKDNGFTQAQLATKVSVSPQAVSKWEKGDAMPDVEMLGQLASIFDVTCDYLILGVEMNNMNEDNTSTENVVENNAQETVEEPKVEFVTEDVVEDAPIEEEVEPQQEEEEKAEEVNAEAKTDTKAEKTHIIEEVGHTPHVKVKPNNNEDTYKAAKRMLGTYKTIKWSAMVMPIIVSALLLAGVIASFVLSFNEMENSIGHIPALCTALVVSIVIALLLANYVVFKTAQKYRLFLDGPVENKYPHNAGGYIMAGFKKFFVWIGKYTIAIKLLYDANKKLKEKIKTLSETVVDLERLRKL